MGQDQVNAVLSDSTSKQKHENRGTTWQTANARSSERQSHIGCRLYPDRHGSRSNFGDQTAACARVCFSRLTISLLTAAT